MAARGSLAKDNVVKILSDAFGSNFIGEVDKKYYVWADDGGEKVQITIALTCPKAFVDAPTSVPKAPVAAKALNFEDDVVETIKPNNEITEQEKKNIADLMARLGL